MVYICACIYLHIYIYMYIEALNDSSAKTKATLHCPQLKSNLVFRIKQALTNN